MKEEMGPEFDDVDWKKLDPRQYDPRRIIREALLDDAPAAAVPVIKPVSRPEPAYLSRQKDAVPSQAHDDSATPFDSEST